MFIITTYNIFYADFSPLGLGFPLAIIFTVLCFYAIYQLVKGKACARRSQRQSAVQPQGTTSINVNDEDSRPDILDDLPPAYDSVMNNSMFIIDSESLNEDPITPLPSYEDATSPDAVIINPSSDLDQPPPPSYETVQLPKFGSGRNGESSTNDRSYNVVYYNRSPRLDDARQNTNSASQNENENENGNSQDQNNNNENNDSNGIRTQQQETEDPNSDPDPHSTRIIRTISESSGSDLPSSNNSNSATITSTSSNTTDSSSSSSSSSNDTNSNTSSQSEDSNSHTSVDNDVSISNQNDGNRTRNVFENQAYVSDSSV